MGVHCHVLEYSRAPVVDGVIKGVKIIGLTSTNGNTYPLDVLRKAMPLYEGAPVYMLHPNNREQKRGSRQLDAHLGSLANIQARADGLYGDLALRQSHPCAGLILENLSKPFGLSHNAICDCNKETQEVLEIMRVNSVDLVDNPGTTTNLFEEDMELKDMQDFAVAQDKAIAERLDAFETKMIAVLESHKPAEKPADKPRRRISAIETRDAGDEEEAPLYELGHEAFAAGLRGINTGGTQS